MEEIYFACNVFKSEPGATCLCQILCKGNEFAKAFHMFQRALRLEWVDHGDMSGTIGLKNARYQNVHLSEWPSICTVDNHSTRVNVFGPEWTSLEIL